MAGLIDGLLLSGGGDIPPEYYGEDISVPEDRLDFVQRQRVEFERLLLKEIIKRRKPVLAVCFGMQLVNVAFGGSLYQDIELQLGNALDHKKDHEIEIIQPSAISPQLSACNVNSSHHQAVKKLGDGLEAFAISGDNIIEGFHKKDYPFLLCVQWHPERIFYDRLSLGLFETFISKASAQRTQR